MMAEPEVQILSEKYQVSAAQILLRFLTQQDIVTIPKSLNPVQVASNFDSLSFKLTTSEVANLKRLDRHQSIKDWPQTMRESAY